MYIHEQSECDVENKTLRIVSSNVRPHTTLKLHLNYSTAHSVMHGWFI